MEFHDTLNVLFWIFLAIFIVFGVVLPLLVFGAALFEKQHVTTLQPLSGAEQRRHQLPPSVQGVIGQDDRPLGIHGYCDAGRKVEPMFLLLSGDGLVLVRAWLKKDDKLKRYELMSRLHSGQWLVTSDLLPFRDMTGLRWEESLPEAPLSMGLYYHRRRIREAGQPCVPFAAETVLAELTEHERQRVTRLYERGLARYVWPAREKWLYTIRGAAKMARQTAGIMARTSQERKRVEALKKELSLPLKA